MSTKKIVLIIAGVTAVLCLIVALFVGGIAWFVFHTIGTSQAADTARTFLFHKKKNKNDNSEVKDFGWLVTGNINVQNGDGVATLYLKVRGENRKVNARVDLSYRNNRDWRVTDASYDRDNQTIQLMEVYEPAPLSASSP